MMEGLDYHFDNFMEIVHQLQGGEFSRRDAINHEVAAYLNRLGQFYYFASSDFVRQATPGSQSLTHIESVLPFRHKFAAHRSIDVPRKDDSEMRAHNLALMTLGSTPLFTIRDPAREEPVTFHRIGDTNKFDVTPRPSGDKSNVWRTSFAGYQIGLEKGETRTFYPERDHDAIIQEAYAVFSLVLRTA